MLRDDFIMKQLQRALEAMARAVGMQVRGDDEAALKQLQQGYLEALRVDRHTFEELDTGTLVSLLGPKETVRILARLMTTEARSLERLGQVDLAARRRTRAIEFYGAVGADPDDKETLKELYAWLKSRRQPS
ncbi:MAG: hypothetical protein KIT72_07985 [Polyangiaceae bacterium]|nr:hypothetical protein [Polyangiaceae bacterium]MCW5790345.1 hypothetical protein [Polyangiaceae bacterium]